MSNRQIADDSYPTANEWRRAEEESNDLSLNRRLYAMLKEENCTDVELLVTTVNDEIKRLPAHKNVLVAMSSVIATKMTRRWEEGGQGKDVIEIPPDVGIEAVERFLEFLYTNGFEEDLSVELYLDLIFLADHYEVENLMGFCDRILINKLDVENCIKIYEKSKLFQSAKCGIVSFNFLKKNFGGILASVSNNWMQISANTWKEILELNYLPNVEEIELFKGLKRWKDENLEGRASDFQDLIKLIRFPLVGIENFAQFVVPSEELEDKLMLQIFVHFADKGPVSGPFKNSQPRNLLEPKDSIELQEFINNSQSLDIIELDGNYSSFTIPENISNLTIRGKKGKEAIIKSKRFGIIIKGQHCKLEGMSIILKPRDSHPDKSFGVKLDDEARRNILNNITITGSSYGMFVLGNENSISNITINYPIETGIHLENETSSNEISNCSILISDKNLKANGLYMGGKGGNKLSSL